MLSLVSSNLLMLLIAALCCLGLGSLLLRRIDVAVPVRMAAGLAATSTLLGLAGLCGVLRAGVVAVLATAAGAYGAVVAVHEIRAATAGERRAGWSAAGTAVLLAFAGLFALFFWVALYPPWNYDETDYHLPTVRRFAETGSLPFIPEIRVPVFPHAAEVLQTAFYFFGGGVSAHLVMLLAAMLTVSITYCWTRSFEGTERGWIAAALALSSPAGVRLAVSGYIEALLTLYVVATVWMFARWKEERETRWLVLAGAFAGAAAGVKYLGLALVAGLALLAFSQARGARVRSAAAFLLPAGAVLLLWYARVLWHTGNPVFPFLGGIFGNTPWDGQTAPKALSQRLVELVRLAIDVVVKPWSFNTYPMARWFTLGIPLIVLGAVFKPKVRLPLGVAGVWLCIFPWLPRDGRFLTLILPLLSVAIAAMFPLPPRGVPSRVFAFLVALVLIRPAALTVQHLIVNSGPPPATEEDRDRFLRAQVKGYSAVEYLNQFAGEDDRVFLCGRSDVVGLYKGTMFGGKEGIASIDRMKAARTPAELRELLRPFGFRWVLETGQCELPALDVPGADQRFERRYRNPLLPATVYRIVAP